MFLSFPRATKMYQFARLPSTSLYIQLGITRHYSGWVAPFGDPRVEGCSTPHRGLSQSSTSFIGFWCQGIHRVLLVS